MNVPGNLSNEQLVRWGIHNILGKPEMADSYFAMRLIRDLNYGARVDSMGGFSFNESSLMGQQARFVPFDQRKAIEELYKLRENINTWEQRRVSFVKVTS